MGMSDNYFSVTLDIAHIGIKIVINSGEYKCVEF